MNSPTVSFRPTTDALLVALEASKIFVRRVEKQADQNDVIYLRNGRVLNIDYATNLLVSVTLTDRSNEGGDVGIASWKVIDGEPIASIVHSIRQI